MSYFRLTYQQEKYQPRVVSGGDSHRSCLLEIRTCFCFGVVSLVQMWWTRVISTFYFEQVNRMRIKTFWWLSYQPTIPCSTFSIYRLVVPTILATLTSLLYAIEQALTARPRITVLVLSLKKSAYVASLLESCDAVVWSFVYLTKSGCFYTCIDILLILIRCNSSNQFLLGQKRRVCIVFDVHYTDSTVFCIIELSSSEWVAVHTIRSPVRFSSDALKKIRYSAF